MADSGPSCELKLVITVTGPMMPVSILEAQVSRFISLKVSWEKREPQIPEKEASERAEHCCQDIRLGQLE